MIRILHIAPDIDGGGVGGVIYNYLSHMDITNFHVEVLVRNYGYKQFLHDQFENLGIRVNYVTRRKNDIKKHFFEVNKILKEGNFDVVHCHDQNWSFAYLYLAKKNDVKVRIAHSHLTMQKHDRLKILILNCFKSYLKHIATGYFACGTDAGTYMWGYRIAHSKQLYVMKNAVDVDSFTFKNAIRTKYRKKMNLYGKTVIGHIGRFNDQKNHRFLIDVFEACHRQKPDTFLLLAGKGELEEEIRKLVKEKGLERYVQFLGLRDDIQNIVNTFDIFLFPSLYEGLPVVGIEAQANGLPCLFSDTITSEVFLLPSTHVLSLTQSVDEWADELCSMIDNLDPSERGSAFEMINKKGFNLRTEAERLRNYYLSETEKRRKS